ncbi:MAG: DNA polymerase III subunit delta [Candidatus Cloacimonadaceae bacterium]
MSKTLTSTQFFAQAATLKPQPAYLITGKDAYLAEKVYEALKQSVRKSIPGFELITLYGDELKVSEISEYLDSYSIFSENRLLVIKNADRLGEEDKNRKQPEKQKRMLELISENLKQPEPTQVIILMAESVDGRLAGWKAVKDACFLIECEPIRHAGHMKSWLESTLREHQKSMDLKAKNLFLEKVELDFCTAENEMEKLFVYLGERKNITEKDVNSTLPISRTGTISDFYKALGSRNSKDTIAKTLEMLANDWKDLQILANIIRFFMSIWKIHILKAKHVTDNEILKSHLNDIFESQRSDYLAYAKKYKAKELPGIFKILLDTDAQIKLSMAESETLMTLCILKICHGE